MERSSVLLKRPLSFFKFSMIEHRLKFFLFCECLNIFQRFYIPIKILCWKWRLKFIVTKSLIGHFVHSVSNLLLVVWYR